MSELFRKDIERAFSFMQRRRKVKEHARRIDNDLQCGRDFNGTTTIKHNDGSVLIFEFAKLDEVDDFIVVYTEHHGFHVYDKEDVNWKFKKYEE